MSRNGETVKNAPLIERLKPCPFCGYEWPTLRQDHGRAEHERKVRITNN